MNMECVEKKAGRAGQTPCFSAAKKNAPSKFCKRFWNFKFESGKSARRDFKIAGMVNVLEIENSNRKDSDKSRGSDFLGIAESVSRQMGLKTLEGRR